MTSTNDGNTASAELAAALASLRSLLDAAEWTGRQFVECDKEFVRNTLIRLLIEQASERDHAAVPAAPPAPPAVSLEAVAEVLAAHEYDAEDCCCACGWPEEIAGTHTLHAATALLAALPALGGVVAGGQPEVVADDGGELGAASDLERLRFFESIDIQGVTTLKPVRLTGHGIAGLRQFARVEAEGPTVLAALRALAERRRKGDGEVG